MKITTIIDCSKYEFCKLPTVIASIYNSFQDITINVAKDDVSELPIDIIYLVSEGAIKLNITKQIEPDPYQDKLMGDIE